MKASKAILLGKAGCAGADCSLLAELCQRKRMMMKAVLWELCFHCTPLWCKAGPVLLVQSRSLTFGLFCLSAMHPKAILPRLILDMKWEPMIQKNLDHLSSSTTSELSQIIHPCELSKDLLIWAKSSWLQFF